MKKYIISLSLIIVFAFYAMLSNQNPIAVIGGTPDNNQNVGAPVTQNTSNTIAATNEPPSSTMPSTPHAQVSAPVNVPTPAPAPTPTPATTALYKDGTYTGDSVDAYFGKMQVTATVQGGKLTDVKVPVYPTDRGTSIRINNAAIPKLVQEAISSQSAQVDVISGATQTSQGFQQSLASALAQAKI